MKITKLRLAGEAGWPDLEIDSLGSRLNVFFAPPQMGKSTIGQLVAQLLYGKTASPWRLRFGQIPVQTQGSIQLEDEENQYVLRRHAKGNQPEQLTIASVDGTSVDRETIRSLLAGLPPHLASRLFAVDFAESPRVDWLLSENFIRDFSQALPSEQRSSASQPIDRRQVDELIRQRDAIAQHLEQQMAVRRRESGQLESELTEVDRELTADRNRAERLRSELKSVETEVAELETRVRYLVSSERYSTEKQRPLDQSSRKSLDEEIATCRQTLADMQLRESGLRAEVARFSPDGTADRVTSLMDGRATLGALEQLVDQLELEISQLARSEQPGRPLRHDTHARLAPMASLLRQHVYTLCGQLTEQERSAQRQQWVAELRQLARVQADLGDQLQLLLDRREMLVRQSQAAARPAHLVPQPPVVEHCRCEHHGSFTDLNETQWLGDFDVEARLRALQTARGKLLDELMALNAKIDRLENRWKDLQRERAGLVNGASIDELREELQRLEATIETALGTAVPDNANPWRASDLLAQLTNGRLTQIRTDRQGDRLTIVDRDQRARSIDVLSPAEYDQLYVALTLALVGSYARRDLRLPLVLDEPFLRQDSASAAAMADVLTEFSRSGHQLLVFTEDRNARDRFSSDIATVFDLPKLRDRGATEAKIADTSSTEAPKPVKKRSTRVVRETWDGRTVPALRLASVEGEQSAEETFYLFESSAIEAFPVLGGETGEAFGHIDIHTVGQLLSADPAEVADRLDRKAITRETVELWQKHMTLMCHVSGITLDDVQLMTACGIHSPDDLFDVDIDRLWESIEQLLTSNRGQRFSSLRSRTTRSNVAHWRKNARRHRDRWNRWQQSHSNRQKPRRSRNGKTRHKNQSPPRTSSPKSTQRFYLGREHPVEDAPSIGPKTADRLAKVGIRTVADLLSADADSVADELDVGHISAAKIVAWQQQARLVCQIPELRGYGAQLLVASGFTEAEQIAKTDAETLVATILACCQTKEGQRILRSGDAPDRKKIVRWVELAAHRRSLEAA